MLLSAALLWLLPSFITASTPPRHVLFVLIDDLGCEGRMHLAGACSCRLLPR